MEMLEQSSDTREQTPKSDDSALELLVMPHQKYPAPTEVTGAAPIEFEEVQKSSPQWLQALHVSPAIAARLTDTLTGIDSAQDRALVETLLRRCPAAIELRVYRRLDYDEVNDTALGDYHAQLIGLAHVYCQLVARDPLLADKLAKAYPYDPDKTDSQRFEDFYRSCCIQQPLRPLIEGELTGTNSMAETACLKGLLDPFFKAHPVANPSPLSELWDYVSRKIGGVSDPSEERLRNAGFDDHQARLLRERNQLLGRRYCV